MANMALDGKTIFVTGAAGFIGSNLCKRLCEEIHEIKVIGIDNMNDYYDVSLKEARLTELGKQSADLYPSDPVPVLKAPSASRWFPEIVHIKF